MIGGHDGDSAVGEPGSADFHDALGGAGDVFQGGGAEGDDGAGADDFDLPMEDGEATGGFFGGGRAVLEASGGFVGVGAAEFDDVGDVDTAGGFAAFESHGGDHLVEELSATADEGAAGAVFFDSGSFADEEDFGIGVAFAEDELGGDFVDVGL